MHIKTVPQNLHLYLAWVPQINQTVWFWNYQPIVSLIVTTISKCSLEIKTITWKFGNFSSQLCKSLKINGDEVYNQEFYFPLQNTLAENVLSSIRSETSNHSVATSKRKHLSFCYFTWKLNASLLLISENKNTKKLSFTSEKIFWNLTFSK